MSVDSSTAVILAALAGGPVAAAVANRYIRPKSPVHERLNHLEDDFRVLQDYTHKLRATIVDLGGTPEPWPDKLTQ